MSSNQRKHNLKLLMSAAIDRAVEKVVESKFHDAEPLIVQHILEQLHGAMETKGSVTPLSIPRKMYNASAGP